MLDNKKVGIKISTFRKKIGYSQEKLAEMLHISPQAISKWENGHTLPETSLLPVLAQIFDCNIDDMIMPAYAFDETIEAEKLDTPEKQAEHIAQIVANKMSDSNFTDKEECIPVIFRMVELAELCRRNGLLALLDEMETEQNSFLKKGVKLLAVKDPDYPEIPVASTSPERIREILQSIISADSYKGTELLNRMIIMQGIVSLANGENPFQIFESLFAMLGEEYIKEENLKVYIDRYKAMRTV